MRALVLVDDVPNEVTAAVLDDLGLGGAVGAGWPRADLDCAGGRVRVCCDDWPILAEALERREGRSIEAFYLGDLADLESAQGSQVGYKGWIYEIRRAVIASDDSPYSYRMVTLTRVGAGPIEWANTRNRTGAGTLCLNPLHADVAETDLGAIGFAGDPLNAILLPPDDPDRELDYFSPDSVSVRRAFRDWLDQSDPSGASTLARRLLEVCDDPLVRPFLKDGGIIDVTQEAEGPSRFELRRSQATAFARYRSEFFSRSASNGSTAFGPRVRAVLRQDLVGQVPLGGARRADASHGWRDYQLGQIHDSIDPMGSFQQVSAMLKDLSPRISVEAQAWLDERMLEVARPKRANVPPNHSLAEQAFLRELARVPWAPDAPDWSPGNDANWAWRTELVDMLRMALGVRAGTLRAIELPWHRPSSRWRLSIEPNGIRTVRYPEQDEGQVLRWRLREAPGTVFLRDAKSQLGFPESMQLGETLRLS